MAVGLSQQAAWARGGSSAAGHALGSARTLILAASLPTWRRRCVGMTAFSGRDGDGADPLGVSALAPFVTVSAVTFMRSREGGAERLALTRPQEADGQAQPTVPSATQALRRPHEPQCARRPVARSQVAHRRVTAVSDAYSVGDEVAR